MSKLSPTASYGHRIEKLEPGAYRICWTIDRYYAQDKKRYPHENTRDTDRAGAKRFIKKWDLDSEVLGEKE